MNFAVPPIADESVESQIQDMDRLGSRNYAEIGVPMFLVAEDLTATAPRGPSADASGRILALLLADAAQTLMRRRPDLTAGDIARLIESLADRHFLALAQPSFSLTSDLHPDHA